MSKSSKYNDELDLIKFINLVLKYKSSVLIITISTFLFGMVINYSKFTENNYKVSVNYSILYHPERVVQLCSSIYKCMNEQISNEIITLLKDGWKYDSSSQKFSLNTSSPLSSKMYLEEFNRINESLTKEIYDSAVNDLIEIDRALENLEFKLESGIKYRDPGFNQTILKTKRLIYSIEKNGKKALYIGKIKINKIPNTIVPTLIISFMMGVIISIIYIIFYNASRNFKKQ
jgi:hypothetical protein